MKMFTDILERSPIVIWRSVFENTRRMKGMLLRALHVVSDGLTSEYCIAAYLFSQKVCHLKRKSGLLFVALYLKTCAVSLQKFYGESTYSHGLLSPKVSLTRCGLPTIIPSFHRKVIRRRDSRADICVKVYLSWFTLARIVLLAPKVSKETFKSLNDSSPDIEKAVDFIHGLHHKIRAVISRYIPHHTTIPVKQGIRWVPTWKSVPNMIVGKDRKKVPSIFTSLSKEFAIFDHIISYQGFETEDERLDSIVNLQEELIVHSGNPLDYLGIPIEGMSSSDLMWTYYELIARGIDVKFGSKLSMGDISGLHLARVAASMAGAGKRRLFIIGNYGIQQLLRPYHDWFMSVLRTIPNDGTFEQHKPLRHVMGSPFVASYDLKSATDRWPRHLMAVVMCNLFGSRLAGQITECCLGATGTSIGPPLTRKLSTTAFTVGTPLGYLCAWPLFALSHHIVVWCAAETVHPGITFRAYGILGDDLVIGDRKVADEYARMLSFLGVDISIPKSLISERGAFEFAKKYFIRDGLGQSFDCSPVSLKALLLARSTLGLATIKRTYSIQSLKCMLRLAGAGYRVMSRLSPLNLKGRWLRLVVYLSYNPGFSEIAFEWWLSAFSQPLDPYLKGRLFHWLLSKVKPKQLQLPSHEDFDKDDDPEVVMEFAEYTVLRNWLQSWLRHYLWYITRLSECSGDLKSLLEAPVVETSWRRRSGDPLIFRYGKVWRLYDLANEMRTGKVTVGILAENNRLKEQLYYPVFWRLHGCSYS